MIRVLQLFRKSNPVFFSIEKVFALVQQRLEARVQLHRIMLPRYTSGFTAICRNLFFVYRAREKKIIYHITGDVHYAALVLPQSRTVLTIHDCVFLHVSSGIKRSILKWLLLEMPVRRAAVVTTISEFSRQEILRYTGCAPEKVIVIPNPVNKGIVFKERAFNQQMPVLLFIGTTPNKNLERVAHALEGMACRLRIIGKPDVSQQTMLAALGIDFSAASDLSEAALADEYVAADIVLFPSAFEGFGLPVLEGQKAGRIVITSNIDPMKAVAGGGAFLVDPFDVASIRQGVQKIIEDPVLRNQLIGRGFENLGAYSVEAVADAYCKVYEQLAS